MRGTHFYLTELALLVVILVVQFLLGRWILAHSSIKPSRKLRIVVWTCVVLSGLWTFSAVALNFTAAPSGLRSAAWVPWFRGCAIVWGFTSIALYVAALLWRPLRMVAPGRRTFIRATGGALIALPFGTAAFSVLIQRRDFRIREVDISIPGLHPDLEGLRLAQLSDIHLSPFLSELDLARAVDMANETRPHVVLITGDLITSRGDPLAACLRQLARLRADAGLLGCLGNHETYTRAEGITAEQGSRLGIQFLRDQSQTFRFGNAAVNFTGVDYQPKGRPYLVDSQRHMSSDSLNVLLSHNPDVFPEAARQGFDLTVSGHTHGGQVTVEILEQSLNVAKFYTPFVYGGYRSGRSNLYVTRGIGTVGVPARLGAPPEVAVLRLCAT